MKKLILSLVFFLLLPALSWAGGTCAVQGVTGADGDTYYVYHNQVLLMCTADASDATMSHTFGAENADRFMGLMSGRYTIGALSYDGAGTDPTADTDLSIVDSDGLYFVTAAGNGADVIDDGDDHSFYFEGPDAADGYPRASASKPWTVAWTNNAVNSAVNYLRLDVTGPANVR